MKKIVLILFFLISSLFSQDEIFKELDCNKTTSEVEKIICSDEELVNYQKEAERQYRFIDEMRISNIRVRNGRNLQNVYQFWQTKRDECKEKDCLLKYYKRNDFFVGAIRWSATEVEKTFTFYETNADYTDIWFPTEIKDIDKNKKLCDDIRSDLVHNFDDINIIPPIVQSVEYNDERLKKALGSCYNARMDLDKSRHPEISVGLFSLWSVDIDKDDKEELIFRRDNYWHYIDKEKCEEALKDPNFNSEKDRVSLKIDYMISNSLYMMPPIFIEYGNEIRILNYDLTGTNTIYDKFSAGGIDIYTFHKDFKTRDGFTIGHGKSQMGSYKLFYPTCDIGFTQYDKNKIN